MEALSDLINEQRNKQSNDRRKAFLTTVASKPLKVQIDEYNDVISRDKKVLLTEYEKHDVSNIKLKQLLKVQELENDYQKYIQERENRATYTNIALESLSKSKQEQYHERIGRLPQTKNTHREKLNTWLYTAAEWVIEDWTLRHNLEYFDYNMANQYAPCDCKISNINVDVKTTTEVGLRSIKVFSRQKKDIESKEIVVGLTSRAPDYRSRSSDHYIYGIFDPSQRVVIDSPLNYLSTNSSGLTPCSFQPLDEYFQLKKHKSYVVKDLDDEVIEYFIESNTCFQVVIQSIIDSQDNLNSFLHKTLSRRHHDFIPVVLELAEKQLISLLPHYLADYLIGRIVDRKPIDTESLSNVLYKIFKPNHDQKTYIDALISIQEIIPRVRCRWHPEETMRDMKISYLLTGSSPTFFANCSHNHLHKTTFYTYSWLNGEKVAYGGNGMISCDAHNCGCLTQNYYSYKIGRRSCNKYGEKAFYSQKNFNWQKYSEWTDQMSIEFENRQVPAGST